MVRLNRRGFPPQMKGDATAFSNTVQNGKPAAMCAAATILFTNSGTSSSELFRLRQCLYARVSRKQRMLPHGSTRAALRYSRKTGTVQLFARAHLRESNSRPLPDCNASTGGVDKENHAF
eukprot:scpid107327/ scgid15283/ 